MKKGGGRREKRANERERGLNKPDLDAALLCEAASVVLPDERQASPARVIQVLSNPGYASLSLTLA